MRVVPHRQEDEQGNVEVHSPVYKQPARNLLLPENIRHEACLFPWATHGEEVVGMAKMLAWALLVVWLLSASGCALCLVGAAGGAAGYHLHGDGYRVQTPVKKAK
jgi:hypothetical protein